MKITLLSKEYSLTFVDDEKYEGRPANHLEGLACAIQDSHPIWRPSISELINILPRSEGGNAVVAAGMAYGAAKSIASEYPGPAILLFGAALNAIGTAPNTELQETISKAQMIIKECGLDVYPELKAVLRAAKERASFDRVSQMLRDEFYNGLVVSGLYAESDIEVVVPKIVKVTNDVRHKGFIERIQVKNIEIREGETSTDIGWLRICDEVTFADDLLRELIPYAQVGCAYRILRQLRVFMGIESVGR
jgi:hypothetical protein